MGIEKNGERTFHEHLHSILLNQIKDGTLQPGQKLPSERDLSNRYNVSRTTAKAAVLRLLNEGLVVRATGKGTFVSQSINQGRLRRQQTGNIAFVLNKRRAYRVPLIEDAVYLSLSQGIQTEATQRGLHFMSTTIDDEDIGEVDSYKALLEKVDGVVLAEPRSLKLADFAKARQLPVVLASPNQEHPPLDSVDIDNEQTGFEATRYLLALGHRRIAFVKGPESITATTLRFEGYRRALGDDGIKPDPALLASGDGWGIDQGIAAFEQLRGAGAHFSAVVCSNDLLAIGALRAARGAGIAVPEELSIIGCDNIELSAHSEPPLSTMDTHIHAIGRAAARRLIERIHGDDGPEQRILFPASLVERGTSARASRQQPQK